MTVTVPLHSHDDPEDFFFLAGTQQVLIKDDQGLQLRDVHAGDYGHIPGGAAPYTPTAMCPASRRSSW